MNNPNQEPQIDDILESLLANYSSVAPRPGLETRILAQLQEKAARPSLWSWNFRWHWAGASIAAVVAMFLFFEMHHHAGRQPQENVQESTVPATSIASKREHGPVVVSHPHPRPQVHVFMAANLPLSQRPAVFPTPTPLSEQEKLMLGYVSGTPRKEIIAQSHPEDTQMSAEMISLEIQEPSEALPDLTHIPQRPSNTR